MHGFVFILIGLQVPFIIRGLGNYPFFQILGYGLLVSLVTIIVRIIWVFTGAFWNNIWTKQGPEAQNDDQQTWKNVLIVAWTGTRGVISLATALAIPLTLRNGSHFPQRNAIIFLSFVVIFVTLVVQGLSLPLLVRILGIKRRAHPEGEEKEVELVLATNTLHFLDEEFPLELDDHLKDQLRSKYEEVVKNLTKEIRIHKKAAQKNETIPVIPPDPMVSAQLEIKKFQRELLIKLHKQGDFSDDAIRRVERKLDIDELKLDLKLPREEQQSRP
jgi:CPA1 family monovalent cation:H+ antiporter